MNQAMKNKAFILEYFNAMSRNEVTPELLAQYTTDQGLIEHIMFFESVFPRYKVIADEMTAEDNRVVVRCHMIGKHEGAFGDIPPTHRTVNLPCVVSYTIENRKIVSHWLIADQMILLEQLGAGQMVAAH